MTKNGILLHQHLYTQDLLHNHSSHISARKRNTSGEPTHFQKDPPLPPDPTNSEHQRWIKIGQRLLGGLLWLSTRTRPDLAFAVSSAAQVLTKDIGLLKVKLRHLLQYLSTTQTLALLYPYPRDREMTDFAVFSDSSFAPSGKHSQSGYIIHLSFANTRHLIHWQSLRETKIAESSAEAELYALATARKFARNFRLLIQESFSTSFVMSLRCDNTAAISMLEEPGWRTRYISIYAEAIRQEMQQRTLRLTYVSTEHQLAGSIDKTYNCAGELHHLPAMGISAFLPIDDHASLLPFYLVASQGEFASSNFWLDTCHCATLLAIVVSLQLCHFASYLCTRRTLPTPSRLQLLVRYSVIAPNNFWHFVLSLAMLRLHFAFPIHTRICATCLVRSALPQPCL